MQQHPTVDNLMGLVMNATSSSAVMADSTQTLPSRHLIPPLLIAEAAVHNAAQTAVISDRRTDVCNCSACYSRKLCICTQGRVQVLICRAFCRSPSAQQWLQMNSCFRLIFQARFWVPMVVLTLYLSLATELRFPIHPGYRGVMVDMLTSLRRSDLHRAVSLGSDIMASLQSLPEHLLCLITRHLEVRDCCSLESTCAPMHQMFGHHREVRRDACCGDFQPPQYARIVCVRPAWCELKLSLQASPGALSWQDHSRQSSPGCCNNTCQIAHTAIIT